MQLRYHPIRNPGLRRLTQSFGEHPEWYNKFTVGGVPLKGHNGVDYGLPTGSEIQAVDDGTVTEAAYDPAGFGYYVLVGHAWGDSLYAHFMKPTGASLQGKTVRAGDLVGLSNNSGNSTGPHLHFGIRVKPYRRDDGWAGYADPMPFIEELNLREQEQLRGGAWRERGVAYNPEAALMRYPRSKNLGVPMTREFDVDRFRCQGFANAIVYVPIGYWDQVKHLSW